mmetsp:Transcript_7832/g.17198  ORF Transcript_7832/g.17198 Transcript_7832/m.17198 type:complete len:311 (+) Transcript_7832:10-942(+)
MAQAIFLPSYSWRSAGPLKFEILLPTFAFNPLIPNITIMATSAQSAEPAVDASQKKIVKLAVLSPQELLDENPKVDVALKNFLSLRLAQSLVGQGDAAAGSTASSAAGPASSLQSPLGLALRGCARVFLKTFNSALPSPEVVGESESSPSSGSDDPCRRADFDIAAYKVAQMVWEKLLKAGHKPAQCLGRSSLLYTFPAIAVQLMGDQGKLAASAKSANVSEPQFQSFLAEFGATISNLEDDASTLTWTSSIHNEVAQRHDARKEEADARAKRATSNEAFSEELRAALQPTGQQPLIEELPDSDEEQEDS